MTPPEDSIEHYGIKGMKWGVRRDRATLNRLAGRKPTNAKKSENKKVKVSRRVASRERRTLTSGELEGRIARLQSEKRLKDLTNADIAPGRTAVKEILTASGKTLATTLLTRATIYGINAALTGTISAKEAAVYITPKPKK